MVFTNGKESQSKTYDPASMLTGAMTSTTISTFSNAAIGDYAQAAFSVALPAGVQMTAEITSVNVMTVTLVNHTAGTVDLASGTLRGLVTKQ